ncbi:hypothetical protein ML462_06100 [Gramella lutea]|uniref:Uncharacterized protein n=1 Tax=Christiangramia lutea TaxID=1607951 RepID=A0A9X1V2Z6_9FLAO|nr:hypothetical protein [Christiangramia lutea]MCH4822741.1 hypothetical protein [Christiangramia lutea]
MDIARIDDFLMYIGRYTTGEECQEKTYYDIAYATWSNLLEEVHEWIISKGGEARIISKLAVPIEKSKLKEAIESNESIDMILCN